MRRGTREEEPTIFYSYLNPYPRTEADKREVARERARIREQHSLDPLPELPRDKVRRLAREFHARVR